MATWLKGLLIAGAFAATTGLVPDHVNYEYALEQDWARRAAWLRAHWPKLTVELPAQGRSARAKPLSPNPTWPAWQDEADPTRNESRWDTASSGALEALQIASADTPSGAPVGALDAAGGDLDEQQEFDLLPSPNHRAIDATVESRRDLIAGLADGLDNLTVAQNFYQYEADASGSPATTVPEAGSLGLLALPALIVWLLRPRARLEHPR